jgi:NhaP-type Na+/H+ or K+/H+ antiporter
VVSGLVMRWYIAPALIFVLCGIALGPFGLDVIDVGTKASNFTLPAELALTVILFNQASTHDLSAAVRRRGVPFRLLVIGIPLSVVLGAVTAVLLVPVGGDLPGGDRGPQRGGAHRCAPRGPPHP